MDFLDSMKLSETASQISSLGNSVDYLASSIDIRLGSLADDIRALRQEIITKDDRLRAINLKSSLRNDFVNGNDVPLEELTVLYIDYRQATAERVNSMTRAFNHKASEGVRIKKDDTMCYVFSVGGIALSKVSENPWFLIATAIGIAGFIYNHFDKLKLKSIPDYTQGDIDRVKQESSSQFMSDIIQRYNLKPNQP